MMNIVRSIVIAIGIGYIFAEFQNLICTTYLTTFFKQNLITLLVALIAINSATLSIVLTKIREILDKKNLHGAFENTKNQMILSIKEQIVLIFVAMVVLGIQESKFIENHLNLSFLLNVLLIGCFIYAINVLYDTAKSVFIILDF